jgi:nicotinamide riboside kinase
MSGEDLFSMDKLIVINLLGGPGTGKSVLASKIFVALKEQQIPVELVREFPKELTWEDRLTALQNQIYVFANQHHQIYILQGKVKVAVVEGSILNSLVYNDPSEELRNLIWSEYNKVDNINIFLERTVPYKNEGRIQTLEQSREKDDQIKEIIDYSNIGYITIDPMDNFSVEIITNTIISKLKK